MNKSMKAALLSALVFPGVGHLYLKKYLSGLALVTSASAALYFLLEAEVERALQIVEKIQRGEVQPNVDAIMESVTQQSSGSDSRMINIALLILFFLWLIAIVDSYMAGRERTSKGL